jgi:putative transposase
VCCCAILDGFSKKVVARVFSTTADTALVHNAVNMAARERTRCEQTVLHADHGSQFTSWAFGENLRRWELRASFGTVATILELTIAMTDYIDNFYNTERRHSYLGNISPTD